MRILFFILPMFVLTLAGCAPRDEAPTQSLFPPQSHSSTGGVETRTIGEG